MDVDLYILCQTCCVSHWCYFVITFNIQHTTWLQPWVFKVKNHRQKVWQSKNTFVGLSISGNQQLNLFKFILLSPNDPYALQPWQHLYQKIFNVYSGCIYILYICTPGSGKSSLVANWTMKTAEQHPNTFVFLHFIGSSADSASYLKLIKRYRYS